MRTRRTHPVSQPQRLGQMPVASLSVALPLALLLACGDSTDDSGPMLEDTDSGFSGNTEGPSASGSSNPTDPTGLDTSGGSGSGYDTLGEGDLRGTLSFTFFAADAANPDPLLGMAGAWRSSEDNIEDVEDFFGVFGLGTQWPAPPADPDTLEQNAVPGTFEWGGPTQWLLAGNGMKLRRGDAEATACLLYYGGSAEVEFPPNSGTVVPNYPVYAATTSVNQPEGCSPDPGTWEPSAEYDIVLYGGDLFETNSLAGQVHTPDALEVTSPDVVTFGTQVAIDQDLEVTWTGDGGENTRLVIRVFDMFGRLFTVNAADDGSYTIAADELAVLTAGPATLIVSRENFEEVPFTDGTVRVLSRYAQWGYIELF